MPRWTAERPWRGTILITAGNSGLGAGMAEQFAREGHAVALCARRLDRLEETRAKILAAAPRAEVRVRGLDVDDHAAVFEVFRAFRAQFGGIDRVIVNAASGRGRPIGTGRAEVNLATANTNFLSALAQCEAALEIFRETGRGHLVLMSSVRAVRGMAGSATVYAASKAALANLAEDIRLETVGTGIRVTTIYPGYIRTPMNEGLVAGWSVTELEPGGARAG
jgi:hypothetical protein